MDLTQRTPDEVARIFAGLLDSFDGEARATALAAHRLLARGEPVGVQDLANEVGIEPAKAERYLDEWSDLYRDEQGRLTGIWGLSLAETPHHLEIDGVPLYTWCAWDTLFIPALIGKAARVRSTCPVTGAEISLVSAPEGVSEINPPATVISMLVPGASDLAADVLGAFCHHVHFFASSEASERWLAEREGDGAFLLSVEEGFRLGRLYNEYRFGGV